MAGETANATCEIGTTFGEFTHAATSEVADALSEIVIDAIEIANAAGEINSSAAATGDLAITISKR